jgi:predicted TIM-barrel fold metal-dependent hydrolase
MTSRHDATEPVCQLRAVDIVCVPHTPREVRAGQIGVDTEFMDKVRMPPKIRAGVELADYVTRMDRAGVATSLLVAPRCGDPRVRYSYAVPYERVAEYCESFPGRFVGVAGIDPSDVMRGLRELEYAVSELGFVGAHLYPHWFEAAPDAGKYYPFYAKCCELGVPIMMQLGHCLDYQRDRVLPSVGRPLTVDRVAIDFPELKLIGIHLGWPWTEELIAMCFKHQNVFMAGDAYAPRHWPAEFVRYANSWGQDKVLFGTDWPVIDPERAVREVLELNLRSEPRAKMLRENALKLFNLSGSLAAELPSPSGSG